jgi:hypothetical protein
MGCEIYTDLKCMSKVIQKESGAVGHTCNPSYLEGRDWEDMLKTETRPLFLTLYKN